MTISDEGTQFFCISPFECPCCGVRSDFDGHCPHCGVALHDQRDAAPWQIDARTYTARVRKPLLIFALLAAYLSFFAIVLGAILGEFLGRGVATAIVFALAAIATHHWHNDPVRSARRAEQRLHSIEAQSKPVAHISDGERVRFEGRAQARRMALAESGAQRLAYVAEEPLASIERFDPRVPKYNAVLSSGGELELRTPEGVPVLVRLDRFVMVNATPMKNGEFIAADATVRVSGVARWVTDEDASGIRTISRHLELVSTENSPIVIEVVPAEKRIEQRITEENGSPTCVRADVRDSRAPRESLELDPRLHASTTPSARREME
jgi:hypothetical protein